MTGIVEDFDDVVIQVIVTKPCRVKEFMVQLVSQHPPPANGTL